MGTEIGDRQWDNFCDQREEEIKQLLGVSRYATVAACIWQEVDSSKVLNAYTHGGGASAVGDKTGDGRNRVESRSMVVMRTSLRDPCPMTEK